MGSITKKVLFIVFIIAKYAQHAIGIIVQLNCGGILTSYLRDEKLFCRNFWRWRHSYRSVVFIHCAAHWIVSTKVIIVTIILAIITLSQVSQVILYNSFEFFCFCIIKLLYWLMATSGLCTGVINWPLVAWYISSYKWKKLLNIYCTYAPII